jgi:hypothetical protein
MRYNGTMVLGLANKIQRDWWLWCDSQREFCAMQRAGLRPAPTESRVWALFVACALFTAEIEAGFFTGDQARDIWTMFD